ncbi:hypothetical protein KZY63_06910 [Prevotella histicola]|uniref:hypothetical protein n=1 Tax=Prevotella histicola TaxID=470565 RepID=UPI001C5E2C4A|nr:hypothetical protein [Prevotella histicola]MBW4712497.1 hypothetical protein [Prevotella histicola]MBW4877103.1 hypothetical protein [Prevotella histicola]MBW4920960.1 hypothetical protein [Prevotella histicola]
MATDSNYRDFVASIAASRENRTFLNSDEDHALDVLVQLFQQAQHDVRIFAGCLCKHVGNKPEYVVALSEFIERGGKLRILLNAYEEECAKDANLYKRLSYYQTQGKPIQIKSANIHPYMEGDPNKKEIHFTIGDECAYRIETDIDKRTAQCNFNNPEFAEKIVKFFDNHFDREDAHELNIIKLFSNDNK